MIVLISGVAGAGKTTVGSALAERLGWDFIEGDDFHPAVNVEKMSRGEPLTDADRVPWLDALRKRIEEHIQAGKPAVVTTSALKRRHRDILHVDHPYVTLVFLDASPELIRERLAERRDHFFDPALLESQFRALERPADVLVLPAEDTVPELVERIVRHLEGS